MAEEGDAAEEEVDGPGLQPCHLLIERAGEASVGRPDRAVFPHPTDIGDAWKEMLCHECRGASQ